MRVPTLKCLQFIISVFKIPTTPVPRSHELDCEYAQVRCPNSSLCPVLIKMVSLILAQPTTEFLLNVFGTYARFQFSTHFLL